MNLTITEILVNVKIVGQRIFDANSFEFQRGFNICYAFFEEQLKKTYLIHQSLLVDEIRELEKKNKGLEELTKISLVGGHLLEQYQIDKYNNALLEKDKQIKQLQSEIQKLKTFHEKEKKSFFEVIKISKPKNQSDDKTTKKQRKALQFIQYLSLDEQFEEYLKNGHL